MINFTLIISLNKSYLFCAVPALLQISVGLWYETCRSERIREVRGTKRESGIMGGENFNKESVSKAAQMLSYMK